MDSKETKILEQILCELRSNNDNCLWGLDEIANYIGMAKSTLQQNIICKKGFPTPIRLTQHRGRRWYPKEVKQWILGHKEGNEKKGRPRATA